MSTSLILYCTIGTAVGVFFGLFTVTSIRENKPRAAIISGVLAAAICMILSAGLICLESYETLFLIPPGLIVLFVILFFIPLGRANPIRIGEINQQVDECDIMFAREEYQPGTEKYKAYYSLRPENKKTDDRIRRLPELLEPGGRYYDSIQSERTAAIFRVIEGLLKSVDGEINPERTETNASEMTGAIKEFTLNLGADEVGIARLNPAFVYSHVGRGPEPWGAPINNHHKFAIAFTLEMAYKQVEKAPCIAITEESARQYLRGAIISVNLAQHIRRMGYPARAHIAGSNYQIILPAVAHDAGLGELGRFGYLISPGFGARVRLGAVTTDLPLVPDKPITFGVQDFCEKCRRCAEVCPSESIPKGRKTIVRGVEKWPLNVETCLNYWRVIGTDCGLCMKVCPFSHPKKLTHDLIRKGIKHSAFARSVSIHGENIFYGRIS